MDYEKFKDKHFINVTRQEALLLIKSLTNQLIHDDCNYGRLESHTDDSEYLSIFVLPDKFKSTREYKEWVKEENKRCKKEED